MRKISGDIAFEIWSQEKLISPEKVVALPISDNRSCTNSQVSLCASAARKLKTKFETELTKFAFMVSTSAFLAPYFLFLFY